MTDRIKQLESKIKNLAFPKSSWQKLISPIEGNKLYEKKGTYNRLVIYKEDPRWTSNFQEGKNWSVSLSDLRNIHKKESFVRYFKTKKEALKYTMKYMRRH